MYNITIVKNFTASDDEIQMAVKCLNDNKQNHVLLLCPLERTKYNFEKSIFMIKANFIKDEILNCMKFDTFNKDLFESFMDQIDNESLCIFKVSVSDEEYYLLAYRTLKNYIKDFPCVYVSLNSRKTYDDVCLHLLDYNETLIIYSDKRKQFTYALNYTYYMSLLEDKKIQQLPVVERAGVPERWKATLFSDIYENIALYTKNKSILCVRKDLYETSLKNSTIINIDSISKKRFIEKKTTEDFKKDVYELVGDEYSVLGEYINRKIKIQMRHNICGNKYEVAPSGFIFQGSRCPKCSRRKPAKK